MVWQPMRRWSTKRAEMSIREYPLLRLGLGIVTPVSILNFINYKRQAQYPPQLDIGYYLLDIEHLKAFMRKQLCN